MKKFVRIVDRPLFEDFDEWKAGRVFFGASNGRTVEEELSNGSSIFHSVESVREIVE